MEILAYLIIIGGVFVIAIVKFGVGGDSGDTDFFG